MKKESRWNLANLGEYAPYFLIFKNAIEKVVREYAEHLTETLPIDKESGQPDFEQLKIQCTNLKIAKDKAADLLDFYYACYLTMATKIDDVPIIPTEHPDIVEKVVDSNPEEIYPDDVTAIRYMVKEETEDEGANSEGK